jgi:uncharacterized protein YaaQ
MKLIIAVIRDNDNDQVCQALTSRGYGIKRVASTGGFLRKGSTTLLICLEDNKVDEAIQTIRDSTSSPEEPGIKRATLFVIQVENFAQI